jgi:hypothetical protein
MNGYFGITDAIRKAFNGTGRVQTITHGDLSSVDLNRQNIYPLVHVTSAGVSMQSTITSYTFNITIMDILDFTRSAEKDEVEPFYGNDNLQDILHDLGLTLEQAMDELRRGDLYEQLYRIENDAINGTAFQSDGENQVAGWSVSVTIITTNSAVNDGLC